MSEKAADSVAVKCIADGKVEFITKAILKEWQQCEACSYIICKECIREYQDYKDDQGIIVCPGSSFRRGIHGMHLGPIKLDEILKITSKKQIKPVTGTLIQKAFYQTKFQGRLDESLDNSMIFQLDLANRGQNTVRQEEWSNMGSVLVKRNRGKYVMWERLAE